VASADAAVSSVTRGVAGALPGICGEVGAVKIHVMDLRKSSLTVVMHTNTHDLSYWLKIVHAILSRVGQVSLISRYRVRHSANRPDTSMQDSRESSRPAGRSEQARKCDRGWEIPTCAR